MNRWLVAAASAWLIGCAVKVETPAPAARVYVTNEASGELSVIDVATHTVIATVPLGKRPRGIQASRDGKLLYVALSGSPFAPPGTDESKLPPPDRTADGVAVIDAVSHKVLKMLDVGPDPEQAAVSADGTRLFVANEDAAMASVFDLNTGKVIHTVKVGEEPEGVTLRPDGKMVYVTSEDEGTVYAIDTTTYAVAGKIAVGHRPRSIAFLADGSKGYVTLENDGAVAVVDAQAHAMLRTVKLGDETVRPMGAVVSPDNKTVYISTGRYGHVMMIDTATDQPAGQIRVGQRPWGIALSRDGKTLYTANGPSNDVSVVDLVSKTEVKRIKVQDRPWGVVVVEP
jgi:YVTN family beta-propeller protein